MPEEIPALRQYRLTEIDLPSPAVAASARGATLPIADPNYLSEVTLTVMLDNRPRRLELHRHSIRAADFRLMVEGEDGVLYQASPPLPATYRGRLADDPNSSVSASIAGGRLRARISSGPDDRWYVQPLGDFVPATTATTTHVIYQPQDVVWPEAYCVARMPDDVPMIEGATSDPLLTGPWSENALVLPKVAELAIDADYEFYVLNNSSMDDTLDDIESVINNVSDIYHRDVETLYALSHVIVRTTSGGPYTSTNNGVLLDQFVAQWNSFHSDVRRDTAHLFTGKNLDGNIIGTAFVGVVCDLGISYGHSQSRYTSSMAARVGLTAHELGHNFNAGHCDGDGDCAIMCSGIGGCSGVLSQFGGRSITDIANFRDSRSCLADFIVPDTYSRWDFDEGAGMVTTDSSGNDREGALRNMEAPAWGPGVVGSSLAFDGMDDFVAVVGYKGVAGAQSRTLAAWIQTASAGDIISWGQYETDGAKWLLKVHSDGRLRLGVTGGSITGTTDLRDGQWHHVAAVFENDGLPDIADAILFVDGIQETPSAIAPQAIFTLPTVNVKIGVILGHSSYFSGRIDDVRMWNYALTESEIRQVWSNIPPSRPEDSRWSLEDGAGPLAANAFSPDRIGTLRNMDDAAWTTGISGGALAFNGIDDFLAIVGYKGVAGTGARTVSAWIRTDAPGEILSWGQTGIAGDKWLFKIHDDGSLRLGVTSGSITASTDLRDNRWHHVAAVLNDDGSPNVSEVRLYVDGAIDAISNTIGQAINTDNAVNVKVGVMLGSERYFDGQIDEIRIHRYALSPKDIALLARFPADVNKSGAVNIDDAGLFFQAWLEPGSSVNFLNPSFEADALADGDKLVGTPSGWFASAGGGGVFNPSPAQWQVRYDGSVPLPQKQVYTLPSSRVNQILETIEPDSIYVLQVDVGAYIDPVPSSMTLRLVAESSFNKTELLLVTVNENTTPQGQLFPLEKGRWVTETVFWNSSERPELVGLPLKVALLGTRVDIDQVRLTRKNGLGNLNLDATVNMADFAYLHRQWLREQP